MKTTDLNIDVAVEELLAKADSDSQKRELAESAGYYESGPTFDPQGDYLCGGCSFRLEPNKCSIVKGDISMTNGGCIIYRHGPQVYQEPLPHVFSQEEVIYTERTPPGFGCKRCEYQKDGHCKQWDIDVEPNACCYANEGPNDITAYGTSEGVKKEWDTRGRGRRENYKTGVPLRVVAYHATDSGHVKYGDGGAFFSPEPTPEYGGKLLKVNLTFNNPLVVGDQVDAVHNLIQGKEAARLEELFVTKLPMGEVDYQIGWHDLDRSIANAARGKGYDGIVYTQPDSLSREEFVALAPKTYSGLKYSGTSEAYGQRLLKKLKEKAAAEFKLPPGMTYEPGRNVFEAAAHKLEGRTEYQGLQISIETDKGSVRSGIGHDGKEWHTKMTYPYGYIRMSEGVDGDHVDCFLGPDQDAKFVYVIHTENPVTGKYDEDKCMLGFNSRGEAKVAFLENYDNPKFFGSMDVLTIDKFKEKVLATKKEPEKIEAYGTSEGVKKEWDSRKRKQRPLPELQPPPPEIGQPIPAVRTDDGSIYYDPDSLGGGKTHYMIARDLKIPPERIVGGGWIKDGVYDESDQSDSRRLGEQARAAWRIGKPMDLHADAIFHGVDIVGFSKPGEEMIRAMMSRVPDELLTNVDRIKADESLQPKHGKYEPTEKTVYINPLIFSLRTRFGKGDGWAYHPELTVVHEIGHSIYFFLPEHQKDDWRQISNWMVGTREGQEKPYEEKRPGWPHTTSKWTHKKYVRFTRHYAERNDDEDFADCFAFSMLNKPHQMDSKKLEFVQNLIRDRVKKYPQALIEGPTKPYGERDLKYDLDARGTSEGVRKSWDTRGRGRHPQPTEPEPRREVVPEGKVTNLLKNAIGEDLWNKYPVYKLAASSLEGKIDPRLLEKNMPEFYVKDNLGDELGGASGVFSPGMFGAPGELGITTEIANEDKHLESYDFGSREKVATQTLLHELGHFWDREYGRETNSLSPQERRDGRAAVDEAHAERERVFAWAKAHGKCDDRGCNLNGVPMKAPRGYALDNPGDWMAENTAAYFYSPETKQKLMDDSPNTYKYLNNLYTGKYLGTEGT